MKSANYAKLGFFVVLGFLLAGVALIYFGSGLWGRSTVDYDVYFDESVQGLDVGSLVRFRGVTVGQVSGIGIAPDGRHVRVTCSLRTGDLRKQNLLAPGAGPPRLAEPAGLRAQLTLIGLTGEELVSLDFFDPATHPAAELPFATSAPTIPSTPSVLTTIEDSLVQASARLPDVARAAQQLADEGQAVMAQLSEADVGARTAQTLRNADALFASFRAIADRLVAERTPENAAHAVEELDSALSRLDAVLAQVGSDRGLVASAQRATDALGAVSRGSGPVGRDLDETLREAHDTLGAVRRLAEELERQPDMLVKGRARRGP